MEKKTFEQNMEDMSKMTPEEMEKAVDELSKICMCINCPTYAGTEENRLLFCATGKSKIIDEEKGCVCLGCPVTEKLSLRWMYYCLRGTGKEQAGI